MTFEIPEWIQAAKVIGYTVLAATGGFVGFVMRSLDKDDKVNWPRAFIEAGAAGFVGLLVFFSCRAIGVSDYWAGLIVGISGWIGAKASIQMLVRLVAKRTPYSVEDKANDAEPT